MHCAKGSMLSGLVSTLSGRCSVLLLLAMYVTVMRANCVQTQHVRPWYPSGSTAFSALSMTLSRNRSYTCEVLE